MSASAGESAGGRRIAVSLPASFFGFYAHAGFVKALDELGVAPDAIAGSSAGALVGAMWAAGLNGTAIEEILLRVKREDFWESWRGFATARAALVGFRGWTGFLEGKRFREILERILPVRSFEECRVPLYLIAADLTDGRRHVFHEGELVPAVAASCAYPLLLAAVRFGDRHFVDGGLVDKVPLDELVADRPDLVLVHYLKSEPDEKEDDPVARRLAPLHLFKRGIDVVRERELEFKLRWVESTGVPIAMIEPAVPAVGPRRLEEGARALSHAYDHAMAVLPGILASLSR